MPAGRRGSRLDEGARGCLGGTSGTHSVRSRPVGFEIPHPNPRDGEILKTTDSSLFIHPYDKFQTIGGHEHHGLKLKRYDEWWASIERSLKLGGIDVISTLFLMQWVATNFIALKYIFPTGHLPSLPHELTMMKKRHHTRRDREPMATLPAYAAQVARAVRSALARYSKGPSGDFFRAFQEQLVDVSR